MRLLLCDLHAPVVRAWEAEFAGCPDVEVRQADLTDQDADAYVSAANSFGEMGGGVDYALRERFGYEIEDWVRDAIEARGGMLPVGEALVVETGDDMVPYLVVAPTMVQPGEVALSQNAYLAMRAALRAASAHARRHPGTLETLAVPGLCTGTGRMDPAQAARQMRRAYEEWTRER